MRLLSNSSIRLLSFKSVYLISRYAVDVAGFTICGTTRILTVTRLDQEKTLDIQLRTTPFQTWAAVCAADQRYH